MKNSVKYSELLKIIEDIQEQLKGNNDIVSAYLIGSSRKEEITGPVSDLDMLFFTEESPKDNTYNKLSELYKKVVEKEICFDCSVYDIPLLKTPYNPFVYPFYKHVQKGRNILKGNEIEILDKSKVEIPYERMSCAESMGFCLKKLRTARIKFEFENYIYRRSIEDIWNSDLKENEKNLLGFRLKEGYLYGIVKRTYSIPINFARDVLNLLNVDFEENNTNIKRKFKEQFQESDLTEFLYKLDKREIKDIINKPEKIKQKLMAAIEWQERVIENLIENNIPKI